MTRWRGALHQAVTGKPIVGTGEGRALETFHPDRMAQRILGMGDVLTLIDQAEKTVDRDVAENLHKRIKSGGAFTLDDMLEQMRQIRKMGPISGILGMIPGLSQMKKLKDAEIDESHLGRVEAIILSMTPAERRKPDIINGSRRKRIAQERDQRRGDQQASRAVQTDAKMMKSLGRAAVCRPCSVCEKQRRALWSSPPRPCGQQENAIYRWWSPTRVPRVTVGISRRSGGTAQIGRRRSHRHRKANAWIGKGAQPASAVASSSRSPRPTPRGGRLTVDDRTAIAAMVTELARGLIDTPDSVSVADREDHVSGWSSS